MAWGSSYGQVVKYGGFGGNKPTPQKTTELNPSGVQAQMDYLKAIPTGYTPEQELAMRNRVRATETAGSRGGVNKIRELMAAQGLGGSGAEISAVGNLLRGNAASRQGALSNIDLSNAGLNLQNQYAKAGLMNAMAGLGENARQFGITTEEDIRRYNQQRADYQQQLRDWLNGLRGGSGGGYAGIGG